MIFEAANAILKLQCKINYEEKKQALSKQNIISLKLFHYVVIAQSLYCHNFLPDTLFK